MSGGEVDQIIWGQSFVGGCDDSLLLLDYLAEHQHIDFESFAQSSEFYQVCEHDLCQTGDLSFALQDIPDARSAMAIDFVFDMSFLLLKYGQRGQLSLSELDENYHQVVTFTYSAKFLEALRAVLANFITHSEQYEIKSLLMEEDLVELRQLATQLYSALKLL